MAFPDKIGPELIEEVRKNTGLSFDKSKIAVETVMGYIGFKIPTLEGVVDKILASLHLGVSSFNSLGGYGGLVVWCWWISTILEFLFRYAYIFC